MGFLMVFSLFSSPHSHFWTIFISYRSVFFWKFNFCVCVFNVKTNMQAVWVNRISPDPSKVYFYWFFRYVTIVSLWNKRRKLTHTKVHKWINFRRLFLYFATSKWFQIVVNTGKERRKQFFMFHVIHHAELSSENLQRDRKLTRIANICCFCLMSPSHPQSSNIWSTSKRRWPRERVEMRKNIFLLLLSFSICEIWYDRQRYWLSFNYEEERKKKVEQTKSDGESTFHFPKETQKATWSSHEEMSRK